MIRDLPKRSLLCLAFVPMQYANTVYPPPVQTLIPKESVVITIFHSPENLYGAPDSITSSKIPITIHPELDAATIFPLPASMEADILTYVNEDRKQHGLSPLKLSAVESSIAEKHSRDMASGKVAFGHRGLNTRAKAIRKALGEISSVGENVASGPMNAREVVDGWLNSPGHKRNIEGDFTLTGIGYAQGKKGNIFFTQIFSK